MAGGVPPDPRGMAPTHLSLRGSGWAAGDPPPRVGGGPHEILGGSGAGGSLHPVCIAPPSTLGCRCHQGGSGSRTPSAGTARLGQGRTGRSGEGPGRAQSGMGGAPPPHLLTQWLVKLRVMTAGAKERAGFMPAPV